MADEDDDIILSELDDEELVAQMHDDLYDGLKEEIEEATNILLGRDWAPYRVLTEALVSGMKVVGDDFRDGILFVPEVLLAANAMKAGMAILKPLLVETGAPKVGKMVIGTVKGDIHDIGKNLVAMMMEGAGFEVVPAHHHHALHEDRDRHADRTGQARQVYRAGGWRTAQRGVRQGDRGRRLLPRRRRGGGDGQGLHGAQA